MRSILHGGLATLLIAGAVAVLVFDWTEVAPDQPTVEANKPLTKERLEKAEVFPEEPVKDDARRVGGEGFGTVEVEEETIARLPAKPLPPKLQKPEGPKLPPVPVSLQHPHIERPGYLQTGGVVVRLAGIVSLDLEQTCDTIGRFRPCGRQARTALRNFIRSRTTICIIPREPRKEAVEAQCTVGGKDVAEWLVEQGWAVADEGSDYEEAMKTARDNQRGLWRDGADAKWLLDAARNQTAAD